MRLFMYSMTMPHTQTLLVVDDDSSMHELVSSTDASPIHPTPFAEKWLSGRKQRFAKPIQPLRQVQENTQNPLASQQLAPFLISPDFL